MRLSRIFLIACCSLLWISAYAKADQVDNPRYLAWAKFGVGSSSTLGGTVSAGGFQMTVEYQFTLQAKADDQMTLQVTTTSTVMGQAHSHDHTQSVPAKTDSKNFQQDGDEKVDAAGKTFDCKVYEIPDMNKQGATAKIWVNDQVPGGMVKMDASSPAGNGTVNFLLKSYEAK